LNISIRDGALIEIKGVQQLELVSKVVEYEVQRQLGLLNIRDELKKRRAKEENIKDEIIDVTSVFNQTKCKVIKKAVSRKQRVMAIKLPKFAGLLKRELAPGMRLGSEIADIARFWGRVGGIFHTDELPAYGITIKEIDDLKKLVKSEPQDAVVFVADAVENATDALKAITQRAKKALRGVPEETRAANPDGTTRYMRPRPGAARMYPETDVPPIQLSEEYVKKLRTCLPELPEQKVKRLTKEYGLNTKLVKQILNSEYVDLFERVAKETKVSPTAIAVALTETMKALGRDGIEVEKVTDEQLRELFGLVDSGETAKEAIPDIITWLSKHEGATVKKAVESLGLAMISQEKLEKIIDDLMRENKSLIAERKEGAFGPLMGMVMKKVRGRVKAELVSEILKRKLKSFIG
jgi:glutamyl-tRNA(Gln) amidotransferase subunit E